MRAISPVGAHVSLACATVQTIPIPDGATGIIMSASAQHIRFTLDGTTDPTTTVGLRLLTTDGPLHLHLRGGNVIKALAETGGGILQYQIIREIG